MKKLKHTENKYLRYLISKREKEEKEWFNSILEDMIKSEWLEKTIERRIEEFNDLKRDEGWPESLIKDEENEVNSLIEDAEKNYLEEEIQIESLIGVAEKEYIAEEEHLKELLENNHDAIRIMELENEEELYEKRAEIDEMLERMHYIEMAFQEKEPFDDLEGIDYPEIPPYDSYEQPQDPIYVEPPFEIDYEPIFEMGDYKDYKEDLRESFEEYLLEQALKEESIESQYGDIIRELESKDAYFEYLIENYDEEHYTESIIEKRLLEEEFLENIIKEAIAESNYFQEEIDRHLCERESIDYDEKYFNYELEFDEFIYNSPHNQVEEYNEPFDDLGGIDYPEIQSQICTENLEGYVIKDEFVEEFYPEDEPFEDYPLSDLEGNRFEDDYMDEDYVDSAQNESDYDKASLESAIEEKFRDDYWLEKTLVELIKEDESLNAIIKERIAKDKEFNEKIDYYLK